MTTAEFLAAIWPATGIFCLMSPSPKTGAKKHFWFDSIKAAASEALALDAAGRTVYHGCASFATDVNRKTQNVAAIKALWMDLDVGESKTTPKFASREAAAAGLKTFMSQTAIPAPKFASAFWRSRPMTPGCRRALPSCRKDVRQQPIWCMNNCSVAKNFHWSRCSRWS